MTSESDYKIEKITITESPYDGSRGHPPYGYYHIRKVWPDGEWEWTVAYISINDGSEFVQEVAEMFAQKYGCKVESEAPE